MNGKIFCVGLSRTGTSSLTRALRILGYKARHDLHGGDSYQCSSYLPLVMEGNFRWPQIDEVTAVLDIPIPLYFKQLDRTYPDSKFILTVRNKEDWLDSCEVWFTRIAKHFDLNQRNLHIDTASFVRAMVYGITYFHRQTFSNI